MRVGYTGRKLVLTVTLAIEGQEKALVSVSAYKTKRKLQNKEHEKNGASLKVADKNDTADITVTAQNRGVSKKTIGIEVKRIN